MIFITVGTHEQPFDRLIEQVDSLIEEKIIQEDVFMQIGYSHYEPKYAKWSRLISYEKMKELENKADVIITHGGPATFMSVLSKGKMPVVVPRQKQYGEHVNDHQLDFARKVMQRGYDIRVVEDIKDLEQVILEIKAKSQGLKQSINNNTFNDNFKSVVWSLVE